MMKWKVYFMDATKDEHVAPLLTTYVGADTAKEAFKEGATKLGIVDVSGYHGHAIPTGDPWEED